MNGEGSEGSATPARGQRIEPAEAMRLAIREGRKGIGFVSPNPLVGCVIVTRDHRFLALGCHHRVGSDHAEIDALKKIPDRASLEGAHVYVSLEPCAHQGRTPSCALALAPLKLGSVTYAVEDPNPLVAGRGAAILREAGVDVSIFADRVDIPAAEREDLSEAAEDLAEIFLHNMRAKEPFFAVKVASSLDGHLAMKSGESKWITGEAAREHVHWLRAGYDAVAVGRGTFETDDPSLDVRHAAFPGFKNRVVVFDPEGKTLSALPNSNLLKAHAPEAIVVVVGERSREANPCGARVLRIPLRGELFAMPELCSALLAEGIHSVMIEGGAKTIGAFFAESKVRRLHLFLAPVLLGGRFGVAWSSAFGTEKMGDRIRIERSEQVRFGDDLHWTGRVHYRYLK